MKSTCSLLVFALSVVACGSATPPPESESSASKTSPAISTAVAPPAETGTAKTCTANADCEKGEICSGEPGCDATWTCQPSRPCTRDLVQYCGCDGKTFSSSGSCAGAKYSKKGGC